MQRRAWPFLAFGPAALAGVLAMVAGDGVWIVVGAVLVGFSLAFTFVLTLALPPLLSAPGDVHRLAAGMLTVSYGFAVAVPIICGALWDLTGRPWTAFIPLMVCPVVLAVLGFALTSRHRHAESG